MRLRLLAAGAYALCVASNVPLARAQERPPVRVRFSDVVAASEVAKRDSDALPAGAARLTPIETLAGEPHAPTPSGKIRVPLAFEGLSGRALEDEQIRITSGAASIQRSPNGAPLLELADETQAIVSSEPGKDSAEHSEIQSDRKTPLPWLVIETRRTDLGVEVRTARPFLTLAKAILWRANEQRHVAEFLFGLDAETGEPGPLAQPLSARFAVTCDDVQPTAARISEVGPGGYGSVVVRCSREVKNERALHELEIHVDRGTLRYPFRMPHRPGPLALRAHASVPGFGFGNLVLTVGRVEEDGSPLAVDARTPVQFVAEQGWLPIDAVVLERGAHEASVHAHPPGIGDLRVRAVAAELQSAPLAVELTWPIFAIAAMVLGGSLGGYLSARAVRGSRRVRRMRVFEGALVGVLITLVVLVLPSFSALPAWARDTELGLFVLAALGGFAGTPLLERAARAYFPSLGRREPS